MNFLARPRLPIVLAVTLLATAPVDAQHFSDGTTAAGLGGAIYLPSPINNGVAIMSGGVAVGDYDGDGWDDLFWLAGSTQPNRLYHNLGDGTFVDLAPQLGLDVAFPGNSPLWVDYDGDGDLDLFVTSLENLGPQGAILGGPGGVGPTLGSAGTGNNFRPKPVTVETYRNFLFRNDGDTFTEVAGQAGVRQSGRWGAAFGDIDGDGWLDLVGLSWNGNEDIHVMRNNGDGTFREATPAEFKGAASKWGFTPRIVDYDDDGDNDLMLVQDIENTYVWRNDGGWEFSDLSFVTDVTKVENGMGTAIGDVDNDGDLDWFITAIYNDGPLVNEFWGISGNRLYLNTGTPLWVDGTDAAGVRDGGFGWGAQFADLDHDADLDLVHVNGYPGPPINPFSQYETDTLRVFVNDGTGVFTESAIALGVEDDDQGRGLVVFDYDRDGALDLLVSNNNVLQQDAGLTLWQGDPQALTGAWIEVDLRGQGPNTFAIGAKVTAAAAGLPTQIRVLEAGNNYLSQAPARVRFGLAGASSVDLTVRWPSGQTTVHPGQAVNQRVLLTEPE